jgi:hypothetical protein
MREGIKRVCIGVGILLAGVGVASALAACGSAATAGTEAAPAATVTVQAPAAPAVTVTTPAPEDTATEDSTTEDAPAEDVKMPDYVGQTLDIAEDELDSMGVTYHEVGGGTFGIVVPSNWTVCQTKPKAGKSIDIATDVALIVKREC